VPPRLVEALFRFASPCGKRKFWTQKPPRIIPSIVPRKPLLFAKTTPYSPKTTPYLSQSIPSTTQPSSPLPHPLHEITKKPHNSARKRSFCLLLLSFLHSLLTTPELILVEFNQRSRKPAKNAFPHLLATCQSLPLASYVFLFYVFFLPRPLRFTESAFSFIQHSSFCIHHSSQLQKRPHFWERFADQKQFDVYFYG
jgi:hypothetical protein